MASPDPATAPTASPLLARIADLAEATWRDVDAAGWNLRNVLFFAVVMSLLLRLATLCILERAGLLRPRASSARRTASSDASASTSGRAKHGNAPAASGTDAPAHRQAPDLTPAEPGRVDAPAVIGPRRATTRPLRPERDAQNDRAVCRGLARGSGSIGQRLPPTRKIGPLTTWASHA